jgi:hypothetical protein
MAVADPINSTFLATFPDGFLSTTVETRIMKHLSSILLATLVSVALMQLYRAHLELKCETNLLTMNDKRTRWQAEKIAGLETKLKALTAGKTQSTDNGSAPAALF